MHQVSYSLEELRTLSERLRTLNETILGLGCVPAIILHQIIRGVVRNKNVTRNFFSQWIKPHDFYYGDYPGHDPKTVYKLIKYQVSAGTKTLQHPLQVMYHLPYVQLPPLMGHKSRVIQTIAAWRIEIGK